MKRITITAILMITAFAAASHAVVPPVLSYQGVLTDAGGAAVSDGTYSVTFSIYDVAAGGTALWTEPKTVQVTKGIFNVYLGTSVALDLPFDQTYYVGISVEGEAELSPRAELTAAPYAMSAGGILGDNVFPEEGNVGIHTDSPNYPLEIFGGATAQVPLYVHGSNPSWTSIYIRAEDGGSRPGYGYVRGGLVAHHYVAIGGTWTLSVAGNERLAVTPTGNVGVGTSSPLEKLDVSGAIRLGDAAGAYAGTIRWTGSDFEGYDGGSWVSFTDTGSGSLPAGTDGQTLRHNGTSWAATSNLYHDGTNIGVGTESPDQRVHIFGIGNQELKVESSVSSGSAAIELKTNDDTNDYLMLEKFGSAASGTVDGINLADLSIIHSGMTGGPMMIDVMTANPLYFMTSNLERMRLDANGNLGINTKSPEAKLHVDGNQWDLDGTEGDFKIGDATYRLKFGVATGGGGAGTAGIRVQGGAETLKLGAGAAEVLTIENDGTVSIGSDTQDGQLHVYRNGVSDDQVWLGSNSEGGYVYTYDESGNIISRMYPDSPQGGILQVRRNETSVGFEVNANWATSGEPAVLVTGSTQSASINLFNTGDETVEFPNDAISAQEILDEPGMTSDWGASGTPVSIGATATVLRSTTISAPASGYVLVIGSAQLYTTHTNGSVSSCALAVSDIETTIPSVQDRFFIIADGAGSGIYSIPGTVHGIFEVVSAGDYTYYLLGDEASGTFVAYDVQVTALFIPTSYGTVTPMLAGAADADPGSARPGPAASEISAERAASIEANNSRLERELAVMREEFEQLKAELRNERDTGE